MGMGFDPMVKAINLEYARRVVEQAREVGNQPRVHPNGFIQLDIDEPVQGWEKKQGHSGGMRRLHIWNPPGFELPHQKTVNEIHDHVFDMKSIVVKGYLVQRLYWFIIGAALQSTHELYRAVYDKRSSSRLESTEIKGVLKLYENFRVAADPHNHFNTPSVYYQHSFTFHETFTNPAISVVTIMEKQAVHDGRPSVICPIGTEPDNDFDRATAADPEYLWQAIEASLSGD